MFNEGYITYSNEAKNRILGVSKATLECFGAVSEETAREMAEGVAKVADADVGISTTGIAGPGGGTPEKPVGLIYVGCFVRNRTYVKELRLTGNREENRQKTVQEALEFVLNKISVVEK